MKAERLLRPIQRVRDRIFDAYLRVLWHLCEWSGAKLEELRGFSPLDMARSDGWCDGMESAAKEVHHYLTMHEEMTPRDIVDSLRAQVRGLRGDPIP